MFMNYGEKIASLRKTNNMTQAELGDALNVTYQAVSKWERGESHPDFETMSKISKLFRVPLSYFEENGELLGEQVAIAEASAAEASPVQQIAGVCTVCGKALYQEEVLIIGQKTVCKPCAERIRLQEQQKKEAEERKRAEAERQAQQRIWAQKANIKRARNKGLIWGGVIAGAALVLFIISIIVAGGDYIGEAIGGTAILTALIFSFTSQMFWGGAVRSCCLGGGFIPNMPGIIFTLDLDGFIFLIVVKLLFAFIKLLFFLVTVLFCAMAAMLISPFTFIPALIRVSRKGVEE